MSDKRLMTKERLAHLKLVAELAGGPAMLELLDHIDAQAERIAALEDAARLTAQASYSRAPLPASRVGRCGDDR